MGLDMCIWRRVGPGDDAKKNLMEQRTWAKKTMLCPVKAKKNGGAFFPNAWFQKPV
jgi:hypothetical protein